MFFLVGCCSAFAQQLISDGPYVFQEGDKWIAYSVRDGKVINIDTRHSEGKSEALLIRKGKTYRVDINGKRRLLFGKNNPGNDGVAVL